MKKVGEFICKNKYIVLIISFVLLILSIIGMNLTKINYDILVYLPEEVETVKGQNILAEDFNMGAYSIAVIDNMPSKKIIELEQEIKNIDGVANVISLYDAIGTNIPIEMLPNDIIEKVHSEKEDLIFITFDDTTSSERTIDAVRNIREITENKVKLSGMSSMVLDTMNLSEKEITIYIIIAVVLCIIVLELSLDSYVVPFILLGNIGFAILFNLGSNIFLGEISYITKALVAVLQLGVTTDFSIFLYHSYEKKKDNYKTREEAMVFAIKETFISVIGSSLTTIVGFLALCAMELTLGKDLGIVMAKGVLLGVLTVLTLFPSLLLIFDKIIDKTKHKPIMPNFNKLNKFIIKHRITIFVVFIILLIPTFLANSKVDVYYKLDSSLPETLESVSTNNVLKEKYNMISTEIVLVSNDLPNDKIIGMVNEINNLDGIDFALTFAELKQIGITENMLSEDLVKIFKNENYQMIVINSNYDIATSELNNQTKKLNSIVKKYDKNSIVAGEGPLMKDLVETYDTDYSKVNIYSIICIFVVLFIVLKSFSLPFLLITAIEFAIFTNLSISYFGGTTLPFIAPITLGTIQLGATIDYAILMTTTYLSKRNSGMKKDEAMLDTMNFCGPSILISGLCFFAATFGVGLYSDIEMIGSICTLISRGALISMLVVIMVLPSILLIFDKLILKTTKKEKKKMKSSIKKISKKATACLLIIGTLFASIPTTTYAFTKNEMVYSKLNNDGSIKNILVNEQLINNEKLEKIIDYSELKDILNVNSGSKYNMDGKKIVWNADGKDIFYQGTINKNLPVELKITYKLNGEEKELKDIIGKSGKVAIELKYKNNDKHDDLYTPFVVTAGTIISGENNTNIEIVNGKVISNGRKYVIAGIAAPGLYESLKLDEIKGLDVVKISFDTAKFELPSIYSVITPKLIESSDLDTFDKLDNIYSEVNSLQDNMNKIENGSKKVTEGSNELKNTLGESINNLSSNKGNALTSEQINGIKNATVNNIKELYTPEYKNNIGNGAWEKVKQELANSNDNTVTNYVKASVTDAVVEYLKSVDEYDDYITCETAKAYMQATGAMTEEQQKSCYIIQNDKMLPYVQKAATTSSSEVASKTTNYIAEKITKNVAADVSETTAIEVSGNVSTTISNQVANNVKDASIDSISSSLSELYKGVTELDNGIQDLSTGLSTFNKEGINKINLLVNSNVKGISTKIKKIVKLGESYSSFGSKDNNVKGSTKFILVVDSQKASTKKIINNKVKVEETFWDRVKKLFN